MGVKHPKDWKLAEVWEDTDAAVLPESHQV